MEYDKIEIQNYLIKRLVDAETAIMEVQRFVDTEHNREAQYPNVFTRIEMALENIDDIRKEVRKEK